MDEIMIQEEFSRLIFMYQQSMEGKGNDQELFQKSMEFLGHLKNELAFGDEESKAAAFRMMQELHQYMKEHAKRISQRLGITEEQLAADIENSTNFTPEQWKNIQESKEKGAVAGKEIVKLFRDEQTKEGKHPPSPEFMASSKKKEPKKKGPKKSGWMRS